MKNTPLQSFMDDQLDHMFLVDKRGNVVFFPWGENKQGYLLESRSLAKKIKKFYKSSFYVGLVIFLISVSLSHDNFWSIVGSTVFSFGGWYLAYYLYITRIVGHLSIATLSYHEMTLEKLEPEAETESTQSEIHFPSQWNRPTPPRKKEIFGKLQHIWYRLSAEQIFMLCFFVGLFTVLLWSTYRPPQWIDADHLVGFFVGFIWGYGAFVETRYMQSFKADWYASTKWKFPMIVMMVACWSLAAWFLYGFLVQVFVHSQ